MGMTALNFFLLGCMVFLIRGGIAFTVESIWIEGPKEEIKFCNAEVNLHCADKLHTNARLMGSPSDVHVIQVYI